jgi:zinc protease
MHHSYQSIRSRLKAHLVLLIVAVLAPITSVNGQSASEPVREQLLNGLKIFLWERPGDPNVMLKLRINSGAAFDLAGKDGMMALLADVLFPDPTAFEYVRDQLGGKLEVVTTYDSIEVSISGNGNQFERMVELLRNATVATQLTPENVARLREERIKQLSATPLTASQMADRAVAQRLFAHFPYARPTEGTAATSAKIERPDLMLARERFLNADNAAIAVFGGVEKARAMRALRQLLGPWSKSDRIVPSSFRQPEPPDARVLVINQPNMTTAEVRIAVRGLARTDRDDPLVTGILARIVRDRWRAASPDLSSVSALHEAHTLPGIFVMSATTPIASASKAVASARQTILTLAETGPTAAEFERARNEALDEMSKRTSQTESMMDAWLDTVTFNISPPVALEDSVRRATASDIQRVAARLFRNAPVAAVAVGNSQQLKTALGDAVEVPPAGINVNASSTSTAPATKKP